LAGHIDLLADRLAANGFSQVHSRIQLRLGTLRLWFLYGSVFNKINYWF
jgi:hypothetical protein